MVKFQEIANISLCEKIEHLYGYMEGGVRIIGSESKGPWMLFVYSLYAKPNYLFRAFLTHNEGGVFLPVPEGVGFSAPMGIDCVKYFDWLYETGERCVINDGGFPAIDNTPRSETGQRL